MLSKRRHVDRLRTMTAERGGTMTRPCSEERHKELRARHRELHAEVVAAADLLALLWRRPDLAEEFADLAARTEQEYGEVLFKLSIVAARLDGELE